MIKLKKCVFARCAGDENIIWNPRESGFTVFKDSLAFLEEFAYEWRDEKVMLKNIAKKFDCDDGEVYEDFYGIVKELEDQRFVVREGWTETICRGELSDMMEGGHARRVTLP